MGIGGISLWQLLIVLLIVVVLFGTKRLRNLGGDLGNAVRSFRSAARDADDDETSEQLGRDQQSEDADFAEKKDQDRG